MRARAFAWVRVAGPYSSDLTLVAAEIAKNYSAVMVAPAAASTSVYRDRPFVFGIARYPMWHPWQRGIGRVHRFIGAVFHCCTV